MLSNIKRGEFNIRICLMSSKVVSLHWQLQKFVLYVFGTCKLILGYLIAYVSAFFGHLRVIEVFSEIIKNRGFKYGN